FFFLYSALDTRDLHSFPTRRSSDLFFAREGWTRFGSPGIFGKLGGYGASPAPSASSRSTHSKSLRRSQTASSMPAWTSPSSAKRDRKSTRLNSSHLGISYAVFCLKK